MLTPTITLGGTMVVEGVPVLVERMHLDLYINQPCQWLGDWAVLYIKGLL